MSNGVTKYSTMTKAGTMLLLFNGRAFFALECGSSSNWGALTPNGYRLAVIGLVPRAYA
jgi:hypothetical protein